MCVFQRDKELSSKVEASEARESREHADEVGAEGKSILYKEVSIRAGGAWTPTDVLRASLRALPPEREPLKSRQPAARVLPTRNM